LVFLIKQSFHCITRGGQHAARQANDVDRR